MNKPERVFVDTNLLLRYLTDDIPEQADAVQTLLEQAARKEIVLVSNSLVMSDSQMPTARHGCWSTA